MEKISVIVPVYNAKKYLDSCIESILGQTYKNIQLILIDDGSTDGSSELCDDFARKDSRVTVFHQKNTGVSSARNVGIEHAEGEYITFVDADDELKKDALERAVCFIKSQNADVVIYGWDIIEKETAEKNRLVESEIIYDNCEDVLYKILNNYSSCGGGYPWNKLWKISSIAKEKKDFPRFKENLFFFEDLEWTVRMVLRTKRIATYPDALYQYYIHDNSVTRSVGNEEKKSISYHQSIENIIEELAVCLKLQSWFKNKYYPEIVNGVIDAARKNQYELKDYLLERMDIVQKEVYQSVTIKMNIKFRCLCMMLLKKIFVREKNARN